MISQDPVKRIEEIVKDVHDKAGGYTEPVLKRYPLLFGFLVVFGIGAVLHGIELFSDSFEIFRSHPTILILIGVIVLTFTGNLYRHLK